MIDNFFLEWTTVKDQQSEVILILNVCHSGPFMLPNELNLGAHQRLINVYRLESAHVLLLATTTFITFTLFRAFFILFIRHGFFFDGLFASFWSLITLIFVRISVSVSISVITLIRQVERLLFEVKNDRVGLLFKDALHILVALRKCLLYKLCALE